MAATSSTSFSDPFYTTKKILDGSNVVAQSHKARQYELVDVLIFLAFSILMIIVPFQEIISLLLGASCIQSFVC